MWSRLANFICLLSLNLSHLFEDIFNAPFDVAAHVFNLA